MQQHTYLPAVHIRMCTQVFVRMQAFKAASPCTLQTLWLEVCAHITHCGQKKNRYNHGLVISEPSLTSPSSLLGQSYSLVRSERQILGATRLSRLPFALPSAKSLAGESQQRDLLATANGADNPGQDEYNRLFSAVLGLLSRRPVFPAAHSAPAAGTQSGILSSVHLLSSAILTQAV